MECSRHHGSPSKCKVGDEQIFTSEIILDNCGRYSILLFQNYLNQTDYVFLTDIHPNGIHLGWQLIQIFVMTVSEIMVSISGLSFAYSESPDSFKSLTQGIWGLTVAVGNLVVVIIAEARFVQSQVYEYLIFAVLLILGTICFIIISFFHNILM